MADIFISYARTDRARAEGLAHALERAGWSVWWDREIPPGRSFDEVIEEALSLARCVVVLWSDASVRSEWVKTEASDAAQRRLLVPILADGARIPLEFRRIQAAAIDDWRNLESNDGWEQLCSAVAALVGTVRRAPPPPVIVRPRRVDVRWAGAGVVMVIALSGAVFLFTRPAPIARPQPSPPAPVVAPPPAAASVAPPPPEPIKPRPSRAIVVKAPVIPAVAARVPEPVRDERSEVPAPLIEPTTAARDVVRRLDREPRMDATAFDVTALYGVFRDQVGRLSVSTDGLRFHETGGNGRAFELSCGALRRVATATMIADREQRLLELTSDGQSYRVRAADTSARDSLRAAISRTCGR